MIGPDATVTLDFALNRLAGVIEKLVVYPENMKKNLDKLGGLHNSQRVLLALTQAGASREDAYALVQRNAMKTWEHGADFLTELKADKDVTAKVSAEPSSRRCSTSAITQARRHDFQARVRVASRPAIPAPRPGQRPARPCRLRKWRYGRLHRPRGLDVHRDWIAKDARLSRHVDAGGIGSALPDRSDPAPQKKLEAINPSLKVPILKDGDDYVIDSVAICQYLADKHTALTFPAGTIARAHQDSFTQFAVDDVGAGCGKPPSTRSHFPPNTAWKTPSGPASLTSIAR